MELPTSTSHRNVGGADVTTTVIRWDKVVWALIDVDGIGHLDKKCPRAGKRATDPLQQADPWPCKTCVELPEDTGPTIDDRWAAKTAQEAAEGSLTARLAHKAGPVAAAAYGARRGPLGAFVYEWQRGKRENDPLRERRPKGEA